MEVLLKLKEFEFRLNEAAKIKDKILSERYEWAEKNRSEIN